MTTFVDQTTLITAAWLNSVDAVVVAVPIVALATVTPAANKLPYFDGASSAALADLSAFVRTLTGSADAPTFLTALDAELAAIAGLTSAADRLPYFTGSGTAALATFTAAGRALVDDADAAAQLTTLGVSTFIKTLIDDADAATAAATLAVLPTAGGTMSGNITLANNKLITAKSVSFNGIVDCGNSGASLTVDFTAGQYQKATMTGNCTFTFTAPTGPSTVQLELTQDGTGSRTMTLPASVKWPAAYAASDKLLSTAASSRDLLVLKWNGTDYVANLLKGIA